MSERLRGVRMGPAGLVAWDDTAADGGYGDWREPTIKELYALILFDGNQGSAPPETDSARRATCGGCTTTSAASATRNSLAADGGTPG